MKKTIKIVVLLLVLAFAFTTAACSLITKDEDKDRAKVIATVDGTDITKGEVMDLVKQYAGSYGYPTDYFTTEGNEQELEEIQRLALDQLITEAVWMHKADELGLTDFTDEERAEFEARTTDFIDSTKSQFELQVVQENDAIGLSYDEKELADEVQRRLDDFLDGYAISEEKLPEIFAKEETYARIQDYVLGDIEISEEEVRSFYDTSLAEQEKTLKGSPEFYDMYIQMGTIILYEPLPTHFVRHILIPINEEDQSLSMEAESLLYDAQTDEEKAAAMAVMEPAFLKILPAVEEIQQKIADGEDFDTLIEEFGKDPGMASNPEGYPVKEGEGTFYENFEKAAVALKTPGEVSEPIKTIIGYHILKLISIDSAGAKAYEDMQAMIQQQLLNNEKSNTWNTKTTEWKEAANIEEEFKKLK